MTQHHPIRTAIAAALLAGLLGAGPAAFAAQDTGAQANTAETTGNQGFYPGTESSATYKLPDGTLIVRAGMPAASQNYGPPPPFASLDTNHDGRISEVEARAYPPLDSDFLYASGGGKYVTRAQYQRWVRTQH